jgi:lipoyl synthase
MSQSKPIAIPVVATRGAKHQTAQGTKAIKDGMKKNSPYHHIPHLPKPDWLKVALNPNQKNYQTLKKIVNHHQLSTVCEQAHCPNINECWSHGTATVMLMGSVCTRACQFCAVDTGNPQGWLDPEEPNKVADLVKKMNLRYVVLTSVNRDDLADGGATHYAKTVQTIRTQNPNTQVEVLTPDFQGKIKDLAPLLQTDLAVFAQNIETVARLTHPIRDPRASYQQTLAVLNYVKKSAPHILTKSSIIVGMGETDAELIQTMEDLKANHVDILTLGQYLRPTLNHLPVDRYVPPKTFATLRTLGLKMGFLEVFSGPLVRSSYRAERIQEKLNSPSE